MNVVPFLAAWSSGQVIWIFWGGENRSVYWVAMSLFSALASRTFLFSTPEKKSTPRITAATTRNATRPIHSPFRPDLAGAAVVCQGCCGS